MKFYDEELAKIGCLDGGCYIQAPRGMHTNGGCRCLSDIRDVQTRQRLMRALLSYREIVGVLANAKLIADETYP